MLDRWFSVIRLPLSWRQFHRLPRDASYKYEYFRKAAWLSPRPKFYRARLALRAAGREPPAEVDARQPLRFRRLEETDWPRLTRTFAIAFERVQPFASLGDRRRLSASRDCLRFTRDGGDGPIIHPACYVALSERSRRPLGAILVTLVPPVDVDHSWSLQWNAPPPADCVERRLGHAHLTWIFVGGWYAGYGVGTALLAHASRSLMELGYTELISSFILGNDSSMLWHWRNGFELLPYSGSLRKFREIMRAAEVDEDDDGVDEAESHPPS